MVEVAGIEPLPQKHLNTGYYMLSTSSVGFLCLLGMTSLSLGGWKFK